MASKIPGAIQTLSLRLFDSCESRRNRLLGARSLSAEVEHTMTAAGLGRIALLLVAVNFEMRIQALATQVAQFPVAIDHSPK